MLKPSKMGGNEGSSDLSLYSELSPAIFPQAPFSHHCQFELFWMARYHVWVWFQMWCPPSVGKSTSTCVASEQRNPHIGYLQKIVECANSFVERTPILNNFLVRQQKLSGKQFFKRVNEYMMRYSELLAHILGNVSIIRIQIMVWKNCCQSIPLR